MNQKINEPVSVMMDFNHNQKRLLPVQIQWKGRDYRVQSVGLHHRFYEGKRLVHIFSVVAGGLFFKLKLNTENLFWNLEEIADGESYPDACGY